MAITSAGVNCDPNPTQATPALNHASRFSPVRGNAAGGHDARPGTWSQNGFDERGPANLLTRKDLDNLAAKLFGQIDLRKGTATRHPGNFSPVAYFGHIGVQAWGDNKVGPPSWI